MSGGQDQVRAGQNAAQMAAPAANQGYNCADCSIGPVESMMAQVERGVAGECLRY